MGSSGGRLTSSHLQNLGEKGCRFMAPRGNKVESLCKAFPRAPSLPAAVRMMDEAASLRGPRTKGRTTPAGTEHLA